MHIPKTAGMSLQGLVRRRYKKAGELRLAYIDNEPLEVTDNLKMVMGHFRFGFHNNAPNREFTYCTFLRNPIEQVVSSYFYAMDFPEKVPNLPSNVNTLLEFAMSNYGYNFQTRFVAGSGPMFGKEDEIYARAEENLKKHFSFVGLTEKFDLSLLMLAKLLDWKIKYYVTRNKGVARKKHREPSEYEIQELTRILKYDIKLYKIGCEIFEKQKQANPQLVKRLPWFRLENRIFQQLEPLYVTLKRLFGKI